MSQSPTVLHAGDRRSSHRKKIAILDRLIENGESWSGNERNCAFLNLGLGDADQVRFASAASVLGLDFNEDSRAHALVDWDHDGDIDLWSTSRTAPRMRFLVNEGRPSHRFLQLKLVGRRCNRDAIGSRVEVRDSNQAVTVQTVRAGSGFLAQSSKWLHFGLGQADSVQSVKVHWADGSEQTFGELAANGRYRLTQGQSQPERIRQRERITYAPNSLELPESTDSALILLSSRVPLPSLPYREFDGVSRRLDATHGRPVWLTFWASWCAPCLQEMNEMTRRQSELEAAGIHVLALSIDGFGQQIDSQKTTLRDAQRMQQQLKFPFATAAALPETVRRLEVVDRLMFGRKTQLALPTSFLISADGHLSAVYRGPVTVDRVIRDAKSLTHSDARLLTEALPFPGRWFDGRRRFAPLTIVADLIDHNALGDACAYVDAHVKELTRQPGFSEVVGALGTELARGKKMKEAMTMYQHVLAVDPKNIPVLNNSAWHLATSEDTKIRNPALAVRQGERAAQLTGWQSIPILDTLATAYQANEQRSQAARTIDKILGLARAADDRERIDRFTKRRNKLKVPTP